MRKDLFLSIIFSIILLLGCGTGTGNPFEPKNGLPSNGNSETPFSHNSLNQIILEYCNLLTGCFSELNQNNCTTTFLNRTDLTPYFNIAEFESLNSAITAEKNAVFNISSSSAKNCIQSVSELQCNDSRVQNSYVPQQNDSWSQLYQLITPACYLEIEINN